MKIIASWNFDVGAKMEESDFSYCLTSELKYNLKIKLNCIKGRLRDSKLQAKEVYITGQPFADNKPMCLPIKTKYTFFQDLMEWNEWMVFPIMYSDLPLSTVICITIWTCHSPRRSVPLGSTSFSLFGKNKTMKKGKYQLLLWQGVEADGSEPTSTPSKVTKNISNILASRNQSSCKEHLAEIVRMEKVCSKAYSVDQKISKRGH